MSDLEVTRPLPGRAARTEIVATSVDALFPLAVGAVSLALAVVLIVGTFQWPPHEDEALALFVGDESLGGLFHTVLHERGGAPLHFVVAWAIVHAGGRLEALRLASTTFAVGSVPVIYALVRRLADRATALAAVTLSAASWVVLFHGVYGRMYGLFLLTSSLSYLTLVMAVRSRRRRDWLLWVLATLAAVAAHPYGAIVVATQGVAVLIRRASLAQAVPAFALVGLAAAPFWYADLVLANRFGVGVGGNGDKLGSAGSVVHYLGRVAGDFSAGWLPVLVFFLGFAAAGLVRLGRERPGAAVLAGVVIAVPALALSLARLGHSISPESRHLIFALPFFSMLVATGVLAAARRTGRPAVAIAAVVLAVAAEVGWAWHKTPQLFRGDAATRIDARADAAAWIALTQRPRDVLLGYEPLYLLAWERAGRRPATVVPRADGKLALRALESAPRPLGRGVFVLDAGDSTNLHPRATIPLRLPTPARRFDARAFGPYLVIRTRRATRSTAAFLDAARRAMELGDRLEIGDAPLNLEAIDVARRELAAQRGRVASAARSLSTSSR